jgi:hypothetical protein
MCTNKGKYGLKALFLLAALEPGRMAQAALAALLLARPQVCWNDRVCRRKKICLMGQENFRDEFADLPSRATDKEAGTALRVPAQVREKSQMVRTDMRC